MRVSDPLKSVQLTSYGLPGLDHLVIYCFIRRVYIQAIKRCAIKISKHYIAPCDCKMDKEKRKKKEHLVIIDSKSRSKEEIIFPKPKNEETK